MKARVFVLAVFLAVSVFLSAQENEAKESIRYSNITEFGFVVTSPQGVGIEATTVHGFSMNKQHHIGLGFGIGGCFHNSFFGGYTPVFFNYRLYFRPEKTFSPHVNVSLGGLIATYGYGAYSSITMGFRAGKFSFSSGLSCMPIYDGMWWSFPFGITLKWGFSF
jgi:hypothetical protein